MGKARRCLFDHDSAVADEKPKQDLLYHDLGSTISYKAALLTPSSEYSSSEESHIPPIQSTPQQITQTQKRKKRKKKKKSPKAAPPAAPITIPTPSKTITIPKANLLIDSPLHDSAERIIQRPASPKADPKNSRRHYSLWAGPASPFFSTSSNPTPAPSDSKQQLACSLFNNIFLDSTQS